MQGTYLPYLPYTLFCLFDLLSSVYLHVYMYTYTYLMYMYLKHNVLEKREYKIMIGSPGEECDD